jgi:hypothetical protein
MKSKAWNKPIYRKLDGHYTARAGDGREWVGYFRGCMGIVEIDGNHHALWLQSWPETGGAQVTLDDGRTVLIHGAEIPNDQRGV